MFDGQDVEARCEEYFKLLDEDKDSLVSFFDLLTPLMPILPPEVTTMFTQDHRFKQETFNDMRTAFDQVSKTADGKTSASILSIRAKLMDHGRRKDLIPQLDNMLALLRLSDEQEIS